MKARKLTMTTQIMLAMILGAIVGIILGDKVSGIKVLGDIFLRLIQMSIVLLVLGQIIEAVGNLNPKTLGKLGVKTIIVFLSSSFLAALYGIFMGELFQSGKGLADKMTSNGTQVEVGRMGSISDVIVDFFPTNIMKSLAEGSIVQVIVFALAFGLALSFVNIEYPENKILPFVEQFNQVIIQMVTLIMKLAPIGIFAIVANTIGEMGIEVVLPLTKYLSVYALATFSFLLIWYLIVCFYCKLSLTKLVKKMMQMSMMALATTSSAVTLPTALKDSEEKLGIKERVSKLVVPLGMSLNSNGSAMHMAITIITIAQIYQVQYSFQEYLYIAVLVTLSSLANAVVPGAGLVSLTIVVPQMGLPLESIALFAGVEWFVGMLRTILNVDSDTLSALIVAKSENEIDMDIFNQ